jgi:hypothetical protein
VAGIGGIGLDLGAQSTNVDVDESTVTEVVVAPDVIEEVFAAVHATRILSEFAEKSELRLGEVEFFAGPNDLSLVGHDLQIAEHEARMTG